MAQMPPDFDDGLDPDGPSDADLDRFGDEHSTCWNCGTDYYDQLDACPNCDAPPRQPGSGMPAWMWVLAAGGVVGFLYVVVF